MLDEHNNLVSAVDNIAIGCSKEWFDIRFGGVDYSNYIDGLYDCIYINDVAIVRSLFDEKDCCKAFFVTLPQGQGISTLDYPSIYERITNEKSIGELTYYDIAGIPENLFGNISQGLSRICYLERYYFMSYGNYYDFYFCSFDYGENYLDYNSLTELIPIESWEGDDEIDLNKLSNKLNNFVVEDRHQGKPNTYGISCLPEATIIDIIIGPSSFDVRRLMK